jgi:hypothetical protein
VSPLVFRNIIFENSPIMPVAFLIHGRKKEKVHSRFFEFVSSVFPKLNRKCVPLVKDRDTELVNAIDKNMISSLVKLLLRSNRETQLLLEYILPYGKLINNTRLYRSSLLI